MNYLHVPSKVLKDCKLVLAKNIFFQDDLKRKWPGKVVNWKDGRTMIRGWAAVCQWNHMKKDGVCICEFLLKEGKKARYHKGAYHLQLWFGAELKLNWTKPSMAKIQYTHFHIKLCLCLCL